MRNISQNNTFLSYHSGFDEQIDEISINVFYQTIPKHPKNPLGSVDQIAPDCTENEARVTQRICPGGGTSNRTTLSSRGWPGTTLRSNQSSLQLPTRTEQSFSLTLALVKLNRLSSTPQIFFGHLSGALACPLHPCIPSGPPGAPREAHQPRACSLNPRASTLES